jgi:hypothetical protein
VLVHRETRRLHEKDIRSANVFQQLKEYLAVSESLQPGLAKRHTDELADLFGERPVGRPAEDLEALIFA